jgi:hypothetical protein
MAARTVATGSRPARPRNPFSDTISSGLGFALIGPASLNPVALPRDRPTGLRQGYRSQQRPALWSLDSGIGRCQQDGTSW